MFIWMFHLGQSKHLSFSCKRAFLLSLSKKNSGTIAWVFSIIMKILKAKGGISWFTVVLILLAWKLGSVALFLPLSCFICSFNSSSLCFSCHFFLLTKMEDVIVPTWKFMLHPHFRVMSTFIFLHIKRCIIEPEQIQKISRDGWLPSVCLKNDWVI